MSNPTDSPKILRRGDAVGIVHRASEYFDEPRNNYHQDAMDHVALLMEKLANDQDPHDASELSDDETGPKTANLPEDKDYSSDKIWELLDVGDLPPHLTDKAWVVLNKHIEAFGFDGRLSNYPAKTRIRTVEGANLVSLPMYSLSPAKQEFIDQQIDAWYAKGIIEPSKSPWGAPVVIAYRNNKPWFCVDYRKLNAITMPDEFPIPRQTDILAALSGAQVLLSLDTLSGFTQLQLHEDDVEKTAFRSHRGLYQFRRMPFGLRNGPSIFQRVMQGILTPYLWIFSLVYINDIVVYLKMFEDHIQHLDQVLQAVKDSGITLSPTKCHFFYSSILLLGHKVSCLGLSTHEEKVRAILELERPMKLSELQMFLGMLVYFQAFIPYFMDHMGPLFENLRKGSLWKWEKEHEYAWLSGKRALQISPVLGHAQEGLPYRLYTDASDSACGCTLQQIQQIKIQDLKGAKAYATLKKA